MKHFIRLFFSFFILLFLSAGLIAQERTISGTVTDVLDGSGLPGVTIIVKGTTTGTVTDLDGKYQIKVPQGSILVFSFVGYENKEIQVSSDVLNVALKVEATQIGEIVVIGYGAVKKSDATGSVVAISSEDFNKGAITNPQDLLVGKSAGVVITPTGGAPGAGATIRIRGGSSLRASNDPLIVIDGVPIDNTNINGLSNPLSIVNPNDIATFTVLKDASATAIFGSRASNGVILITTKKGISGQALRLSYNGNVSIGTVPKYVDVLSADEFKALAQEKLGSNNIDEKALARLGSANTDWQKEIYRSSISHDHNLSAAGIVSKMPYRAALGFTDQKGILKNTDLKRTTLSFGIEPTLLDKNLKISINGKGMFITQNYGNTGAVGSAVVFDPTQSVMNENRRYAGYTTWTIDGQPDGEFNQMATSNPVAQVDLTEDKADVYRGIGNFSADYKFPFLPELRANLNLGIDTYKSKENWNTDTTAIWTRRGGYGQIRNRNQEGSNKVIDFYFNYLKDIKSAKSKVDLTAGYSWQHFWRKGDNFDRSVIADAHPLFVSDSSNYETENYLVSFFGRLNYTLADRYLLTLTVRDDGSSRFAEENRWGIFPSVALAWKIKDETFFKDVKAINDLKLRLGWGVTGQQNISDNDYPYMGTYRISVASAYYQFGSNYYPTLRPNAYDLNIKWEETTTQNIGLDFSLLSDRISGSFDLYKRVTNDLINYIAIPNGSNFSNYLMTNVGSLENKGYEITLDVKPVSKQNISWTVGFNLTYNENKITKLTRSDDPSYNGVQAGGISGGVGNQVQIHSVNYPANSFFVLQQVYGSNGMPIEGLYVDRSGKGGNVAGSLANYYRYKKPAPDYLMGISSRFNYKDFDCAFSSRISLGNYVYNNIASQTFYANLFNNNYWQNLSTSIKDTKFNNAQYFSDYYIENASFFKMDNISLGYSFAANKFKGHLSFTLQNAFTITKYKGLDPEVNNGTDLGIDNNIYPRPRIFMVGLNLDF